MKDYETTYRWLAGACLTLGVFCFVFRMGYPGWVTPIWGFYGLPALAMLGLAAGTVAMFLQLPVRQALFLPLAIVVYVVTVFFVGTPAALFWLPVGAGVCVGGVTAVLIRRQTSDLLLVSLSIGVGLIFFQFAISLADTMMVQYIYEKPWPY